jgi:ribosomal protein S12 methylthiotransferase accessory factor YcaO
MVVAGAALAAALVSGMSSGTTQHDARCQGLHAQAKVWHDAAAGQSDPKLKARYKKKGDALEAQANRCDAQGTTSSTTSTTKP